MKKTETKTNRNVLNKRNKKSFNEDEESFRRSFRSDFSQDKNYIKSKN